jgi:predicted N-acetyltransferase YhbS/catechol 2,3-dioxygenase-like lactoylglutathione lyase family enzyme
MIFKHQVPILYSTDIPRSIAYYTGVLGFEHKWEWGSPPTFGGVSKDHVEIFFCKDGQGHPGTWMSIFIQNVDEYHETIREKGAKIINPPQTYEWGVRELLVEDPDGHRIRFGHSAGIRHGKSEPHLPEDIQIVNRAPTTEEYLQLLKAVGWESKSSTDSVEKILAAPLFAAVAEHNGQAIGCALLLGDGATFYYVKDVMVAPAWQCKRVGSALMQAISDWLNKNGVDNALVALITGEGLVPFYHSFGFHPAFAMQRRLKIS